MLEEDTCGKILILENDIAKEITGRLTEPQPTREMRTVNVSTI